MMFSSRRSRSALFSHSNGINRLFVIKFTKVLILLIGWMAVHSLLEFDNIISEKFVNCQPEFPYYLNW